MSVVMTELPEQKERKMSFSKLLPHKDRWFVLGVVTLAAGLPLLVVFLG